VLKLTPRQGTPMRAHKRPPESNLGNTECDTQYAVPQHMMGVVPNTVVERAPKLLPIRVWAAEPLAPMQHSEARLRKSSET